VAPDQHFFVDQPQAERPEDRSITEFRFPALRDSVDHWRIPMDRSIAILAALSLFTVLTLSSSAAADIYRWDDEKGSRHLVNDINDVPPEYREAAFADQAERRATNGRVNIVDDSDAAKASPGPSRAEVPAAAQAPSQPAANPMPGGQSEMWWRQTALQLERNVSSAKSALSKGQTSHDEDDSVTVGGRGRRGPGTGPSPGGRRHPRGRAGSGSDDYTDYSRETDLDSLEVAVEDAERAYADFHDEARRADVPAGWLRR
jgi:hypothetical protein